MNTKQILVGIAVALTSSVQAQTQYKGSELVRDCTIASDIFDHSEEVTDHLTREMVRNSERCVNYIEGSIAVGGILSDLMVKTPELAQFRFCVPAEGSNLAKVIRDVLRRLRSQDQAILAKLPASLFLFSALHDSYPCAPAPGTEGPKPTK